MEHCPVGTPFPGPDEMGLALRVDPHRLGGNARFLVMCCQVFLLRKVGITLMQLMSRVDIATTRTKSPVSLLSSFCPCSWSSFHAHHVASTNRSRQVLYDCYCDRQRKLYAHGDIQQLACYFKSETLMRQKVALNTIVLYDQIIYQLASTIDKV